MAMTITTFAVTPTGIGWPDYTENDYINNTVPAADSVANALIRDVLGQKTDTAIGVPDNVSSAMRMLKGILTIVGGLSSGGAQGLYYYGVVTAAAAPSFTIPLLAGLGAGKFFDVTAPYQAFVFRDAGGAGAAPQGEIQPVTAYNTATGAFTTNAFTVAVAIGDEILIINPKIIAAAGGSVIVPIADSVDNLLERDVVGNKADTALATADTSSVINLLRYIISSGIGLQAIFNLVNALLTLTETSGTVTATGPGTEDDIYLVAAPAGVFKPVAVKIDTTNMLAGDSITVRAYERIVAAGGLILADAMIFVGVQAIPLKTINLDPNRFGIQVTLEQTAGASRDFDWSATYEG